MSDNSIFSPNFIQMSPQNVRVIDTNELFAKKMEELGSVIHASDLASHEEEEMDPATAMLTADSDADGFMPMDGLESVSYDEASVVGENKLSPEDVEDQCKAMLEDAQATADSIIANANIEAENIKSDAYAKASADGYNDGMARANAEFENMKQDIADTRAALFADFEAKLAQIEPKLVNAIAGVYERVFHDGLYDMTDVIVYVINRVLMQMDEEDGIVVHVSEDNYEDVDNAKEVLFRHFSADKTPQIRISPQLTAGQAKIETSHGMIDCSVDTQLKELSKALSILSYGGDDNE